MKCTKSMSQSNLKTFGPRGNQVPKKFILQIIFVARYICSETTYLDLKHLFVKPREINLHMKCKRELDGEINKQENYQK